MPNTPQNAIDTGALLNALFNSAVAAAQPEVCMAGALPSVPKGRTVVVGAGKASAEMARVLESCWPGPLRGVVVTAYGHAVDCQQIRILEASHPVPDHNSLTAAQQILQTVQGLGPDDLVICLMSGGGSSLMCLPAPGVSLDDKQHLHRALLRSGATIAEMNAVRKHLSAIKGGRLAQAVFPASLCTLVISDVAGDDLATIASGPTVPDPTTLTQARQTLKDYDIPVPPTVAALWASDHAETPKAQDFAQQRAETHLIATPKRSLEAAAAIGQQAGFKVQIISDRLEGEASLVARQHVDLVEAILQGRGPMSPPCILLSGGETSVRVVGQGRGGRNAEFGMALAVGLQGNPRVFALACDTDGIDGTEDNAGVMVYPDTLTRGAALGMQIDDYRNNNDGYGYFSRLGDLVMTGPTRTNVNDFRAVVIL